MATNRTQKKRKPVHGSADIAEAAKYFRILHLMPGTSPWAACKSKTEITAFWRKHRREILIEDDRQRQALGKPFRRSGIYMDELEAKHKRRQTGVERWIGPCRPDGGDRTEVDPVYEDDAAYLHRLGLLAGWELEAYRLQGGTNER